MPFVMMRGMKMTKTTIAWALRRGINQGKGASRYAYAKDRVPALVYGGGRAPHEYLT